MALADFFFSRRDIKLSLKEIQLRASAGSAVIGRF